MPISAQPFLEPSFEYMKVVKFVLTNSAVVPKWA